MTAFTIHARSFSLRLGLFYAALFVLYGIQLPFFPVWLDSRGLTAAEIGLVTSVPLFLRLLIGPATAFLADRSGDHRRMILLAASVGLAAVLVLSQSHGLLAILIFTAVFLVGAQSTGPMGEAIALSGVRQLGVDYGRMRVWGSVSFIAATLAGGAIVEQFAAPAVMGMLIASAAALLVAGWILPKPMQPAAFAKGAASQLTLQQVGAVAGSRTFILFLVAVGSIQASHAVFYVFGALHWQAQGISSSAIGTLWSIGVLVEIALFAMAGRYLDIVGPLGFILAGAGSAVIRWGVMAFDPPLLALVPLQVLHGFTFGATHFGAMHFISRVVPQEQAGTAQALVAAATGGLGMGAATLAAGFLYGPYGGLSYLAMAAMAGVGLGAALMLIRRT